VYGDKYFIVCVGILTTSLVLKEMHRIITKILQYQRKKLQLQVITGIFNISTIILSTWMVALLMDMIFSLSTSSRWLLLIICLVVSSTLILIFVIFPFKQLLWLSARKDLSSIAYEIGMYYHNIGDKLVNTYQLLTQNIGSVSDQLRLEAIDRFDNVIKHIDFRKKVLFKDNILSIPSLLILFFANILLYNAFNERLEIAFLRIIHPSSNISLLPEGELIVTPGNTNILMGTDLTIEVTSNYAGISNCYLEFKRETDSEYEQFLLTYNNSAFEGVLKNLRHTIIYQAVAEVENEFNQKETVRSPFYEAEVMIPPFVTELNVKVEPPPYTRLETEYLEKNSGSILAYPGSQVTIRAAVNKIIAEASIHFSDSTHMNSAIKGKTLVSSFTVLNPVNYFIRVTDLKGIKNPNPIEYPITQLTDQYPSVSILAPGEDIEIATDAAFNLVIEGDDDFGLTNLTLYYQIISSMMETQDSIWRKISLKSTFSGEKYIQFSYTWDFQYLPVGFEDVVHYYVEIKDNDIIRGPKLTKSQMYSLFFPTLNQMLNEFDDEQEEGLEELKEISRRNEELEDEVEKINREIKREESINWERKQEIENILQQQKELQKRLQEIQDNLNQALQKLDQNELISPEILEKYQQLQEMFMEIATPDLIKAMQDIQNALEKIDKKNLDNAMDSFKINQQNLKENIERTLELFKKIQKEQQYDALMQLAKKIAQEQDKISNQIENDHSTSKDGIKEKQSSQKDNLSMLDESIKEYSQRDFPQLEQVSSFIEEQAISDKMDKVIEFVSSDEKMSAQQMSMDISSDMNTIYSQMQNLRQEMAANEKNRLMDKMKQIMHDLIQLSFEEEALKNKSETISTYSDEYIDLGQRQQEISENLRQVTSALVTLSHETFFIPPDLSKHIGTAYTQMMQSISSLEERNHRAAMDKQKNAMSSLNTAVMSLQNSMQMMAMASSASGFEYFLQQMQQMAGQQSKLNEESLNLFQGSANQGSLSSEQMAELARLAAEQRKIRESLESLSKEMGSRSDIPGRLDDMASEMEQVEKEFERMQVDRQTIARQQQILRRMLDAQKSVHEREYSQKRKAESGKTYSRKTPDKNQKAVNDLLERLEMEKQQALREGYSHDYEKLIEAYYKKLSESSPEN
jgi:hypothetical protein